MDYRDMIGYRIRKLRESKGLTREKFAEAVALSPGFITELEYGSKGASVESLAKICDAFDISADYLIFGREKTLTSPLSETFAKIPSHYTATAEKLLDALLESISISQSSEE